MLRSKSRKTKIGTTIYNYILNNKRGYFIVTVLFFIGLIIGVLFINNAEDAYIEEINTYLSELVNNVKTYEKIDLYSLLKESIIANFLVIFILWFGASTIIGIPIVYGTILAKGFTIGYTISSLIACFEIKNGIIISLSVLLLHNMVFIPTMLSTSISGVSLYQSIMKNKNKNNIKLEILRHTIFCALMMILMLISSLIEIYISTNLFIIIVKIL